MRMFITIYFDIKYIQQKTIKEQLPNQSPRLRKLVELVTTFTS
jgi:hypothetical protein